MAAKSSMSTRKIEVFTTSPKPRFIAASTACNFSMVTRVCSPIDSGVLPSELKAA